jgi:hypothetical protein
MCILITHAIHYVGFISRMPRLMSLICPDRLIACYLQPEWPIAQDNRRDLAEPIKWIPSVNETDYDSFKRETSNVYAWVEWSTPRDK